MVIIKISLKRTAKSKWENAILIEGKDDLIIDRSGKVVQNPIWNYERDYHELTIDISAIMHAENVRK